MCERPVLDLATMLRLESINTRDLVGLVAKAKRLGYSGTNIVEGNALDCPAHEADGGPRPSLGTRSASKVPDVERNQGSNSAASELSPAEASRGPKRRRKNEDGFLSFKGLRRTRAHATRPALTTLDKPSGNNVRQRVGCMRMQAQAHRTAMASGKSGVEPPTNCGTVLQAESPCPRSSTAVKRPRFQNGVHPIAPSDVRQGALTQPTDLVVISDSQHVVVEMIYRAGRQRP